MRAFCWFCLHTVLGLCKHESSSKITHFFTGVLNCCFQLQRLSSDVQQLSGLTKVCSDAGLTHYYEYVHSTFLHCGCCCRCSTWRFLRAEGVTSNANLEEYEDLGRRSKVPSLVLFYSKTLLVVPGSARKSVTGTLC